MQIFKTIQFYPSKDRVSQIMLFLPVRNFAEYRVKKNSPNSLTHQNYLNYQTIKTI